MKGSIISAAAIALFLAAEALTRVSYAAPPQSEAGFRGGVVVFETDGRVGISVRMVEELAKAINDGATRRVLPVIGIGSLQNIMDLKLLRGIDGRSYRRTCSITQSRRIYSRA